MSKGKKRFSAADRAKFAEEREAKVAGAQATLKEGLAKLVTGEDWRAMLQGIAKNARLRLSPRRYSFGNQMIVMSEAWIRNVDGSAVGTFKAWEHVGRKVKAGEKAVYILSPRVWKREVENDAGDKEERKGVFFRALPVFLLGQTEGEPLPEAPSLVEPKVEANDERFALHLDVMRDVALAIDGQPVASFTVRKREPDDHPAALGWYRRATRDIVVVDTGNQASMFSTACHEVAHALMHGVDHHGYAWNEVEAESVSFIVTSVFGLDTSGFTFPYVATWANRNEAEKDPVKVIQKSGERIVKAVNRILDALLGEVDEGEDEEEIAADAAQ